LTISTRLPAEVRTRLAAEATILGFEAQERVNGLVIVNRKATIQAAQPISKDEPTAPSEAQLSVIDSLAPGVSHTFSSALPQAVLDGLAEHAAACGLTAKVTSAGLVVMKAASGTTLEEQLERLRNLAPGASLTISTRLPAEVRTRLAAEATILGFEAQERGNGLVIVNRKATVVVPQAAPGTRVEEHVERIRNLQPGSSLTISTRVPAKIRQQLAAKAKALRFDARERANGLVIVRPKAAVVTASDQAVKLSEEQRAAIDALAPGAEQTFSDSLPPAVLTALHKYASSRGLLTAFLPQGLCVWKVFDGPSALREQMQRVRAMAHGESITISTHISDAVRLQLAAKATALGLIVQVRTNGLLITKPKSVTTCPKSRWTPAPPPAATDGDDSPDVVYAKYASKLLELPAGSSLSLACSNLPKVTVGRLAVLAATLGLQVTAESGGRIKFQRAQDSEPAVTVVERHRPKSPRDVKKCWIRDRH
jgi:hypothetical protein